MYYLLTENFKEQEKVLVNKILETGSIEKIYMLGSTLNQRRTESIFVRDAPSCRTAGHYYLLILVNKNAAYSYNDFQDRIENGCRDLVPVTAIVLGVDQFTKWIGERHPFPETVCRIAALLYGHSDLKSTEGKCFTGMIKNEHTQEYWTEEYNKVNEFIEGSKLYIIRQQNKMAVFMLHQAAEHALRSIFKKASGLHINTHNLDKLVRYCSMVSYQIPDIFSRNNEKEERLFQLLQKAYIGTRYKQDFAITKNDVEIILDKIKTLQKIMQNPAKN
ncbi:MAG: HEPN domain-containing protein [Ferruginibacter sp.]